MKLVCSTSCESRMPSLSTSIPVRMACPPLLQFCPSGSGWMNISEDSPCWPSAPSSPGLPVLAVFSISLRLQSKAVADIDRQISNTNATAILRFGEVAMATALLFFADSLILFLEPYFPSFGGGGGTFSSSGGGGGTFSSLSGGGGGTALPCIGPWTALGSGLARVGSAIPQT